ncbi:MAG: hypothetical protein ACRYFS_08750 [Janthinobacterium lividum]
MNLTRKTRSAAKLFPAALRLAVAAGTLLTATAALADDPTSMAPPVQINAPSGVTADSVFNWQEVPAKQQVPLTRATFDQGGYQLYDTAGETIIVPFANQNLYVMKFARSDNGTLYFVNSGKTPLLYVPQDGYLENATVAGAHWYPFGQNFHPSEPVYIGIAPDWSSFVGMGWYPDMDCYGGYYGQTSFLAGGIFLPSAGFFFEIGGSPCYGWDGYHRYFEGHPGFYHTAIYRHSFYRAAGRPRASFQQFGGAGHSYYAHRAFAGSPNFSSRQGTNRYQITIGHQSIGSGQNFSNRQNPGGQHIFQGGGGSHVFQGSSNRGSSASGQNNHSFGSRSGSGGNHSFQGGGRSAGGGHQGGGGRR